METIFRKVSVTEEMPMNKQIVFAIEKNDKQVLCVFEDGRFYRHTDDSGNDRLLRFSYPDIKYWLEENELPNEDEIEKSAEKYSEEYVGANINEQLGMINSYTACAKWYRELVLAGEAVTPNNTKPNSH
jgi:hypothetical protein